MSTRSGASYTAGLGSGNNSPTPTVYATEVLDDPGLQHLTHNTYQPAPLNGDGLGDPDLAGRGNPLGPDQDTPERGQAPPQDPGPVAYAPTPLRTQDDGVGRQPKRFATPASVPTSTDADAYLSQQLGLAASYKSQCSYATPDDATKRFATPASVPASTDAGAYLPQQLGLAASLKSQCSYTTPDDAPTLQHPPPRLSSVGGPAQPSPPSGTRQIGTPRLLSQNGRYAPTDPAGGSISGGGWGRHMVPPLPTRRLEEAATDQAIGGPVRQPSEWRAPPPPAFCLEEADRAARSPPRAGPPDRAFACLGSPGRYDYNQHQAYKCQPPPAHPPELPFVQAGWANRSYQHDRPGWASQPYLNDSGRYDYNQHQAYNCQPPPAHHNELPFVEAGWANRSHQQSPFRLNESSCNEFVKINVMRSNSLNDPSRRSASTTNPIPHYNFSQGGVGGGMHLHSQRWLDTPILEGIGEALAEFLRFLQAQIVEIREDAEEDILQSTINAKKDAFAIWGTRNFQQRIKWIDDDLKFRASLHEYGAGAVDHICGLRAALLEIRDRLQSNTAVAAAATHQPRLQSANGWARDVAAPNDSNTAVAAAAAAPAAAATAPAAAATRQPRLQSPNGCVMS